MGKMIYSIKAEYHDVESLTKILGDHPEIQFVSLMGVDIGGNGTDEKIPVKLFIKDMEEMLKYGIQTDGSSVELQGIADLGDARVDLLPDTECTWFVDYNYEYYNEENGLPVGTLKIPSFIIHNNKMVCSRSVLKRAEVNFKKEISGLLKKAPHIGESLGFKYEDLDEVLLTVATELEMWVKTPEQSADFEELHASQVLKEQYWKRTMGMVRTVLEKIMGLLELYDLKPEMAHKELMRRGKKTTIDRDWTAYYVNSKGENVYFNQSMTEQIYNDSFFEASQGFKNKDADFSTRYAQSTDQTVIEDVMGHRESYGKDLDKMLDKKLHHVALDNPDKVAATVSEKGKEWFQRGDELMAKASEVADPSKRQLILADAISQKMEGNRQLVKQFDNCINPRDVARRSGAEASKIPERLRVAVEMCRKQLEKDSNIPFTDLENSLQALGFTPDSLADSLGQVIRQIG
jgi:hypothetical protein